MKVARISLFAALLVACSAVHGFGQTAVNVRVQNLLDQMTLEEKVGQMTQLTIEVVSVGDGTGIREPLMLDRKKLREALETMKIYDAGGVFISFAANRHSGSRFVDITILNRSGKLLR